MNMFMYTCVLCCLCVLVKSDVSVLVTRVVSVPLAVSVPLCMFVLCSYNFVCRRRSLSTLGSALFGRK